MGTDLFGWNSQNQDPGWAGISLLCAATVRWRVWTVLSKHSSLRQGLMQVMERNTAFCISGPMHLWLGTKWYDWHFKDNTGSFGKRRPWWGRVGGQRPCWSLLGELGWLGRGLRSRGGNKSIRGRDIVKGEPGRLDWGWNMDRRRFVTEWKGIRAESVEPFPPCKT